MNRPINHCYWVMPGRFLAGEYPRDLDDASSQAKIRALLDAGIAAFIDLTHPADGLKPYAHLLQGAVHRPFPIGDYQAPHSRAYTREILDAIDAHLAAGDGVYVHCWGGVGRTGTIVGCWLARHGYPGQAALDRLQELWKACPKSGWRASPETPDQARYIVEWVED